MFEQSTSDARGAHRLKHRCVAGGACQGPLVDGEPEPGLCENPHSLCRACTNHWGDAVGDLRNDWKMLRATLGERHTQDRAPVSSSRSVGIPIDATSDRLMTEIVEWAGYAADLVSDALNTARPDGSRKLAQVPQIRLDDDGTEVAELSDPESGSVAELTWENTRPPEGDRLAAYLAVIEPHLAKLAEHPSEDVEVWAQPQRCPEHVDEIASARRMLDLARTIKDAGEITAAAKALQVAYAKAGACNECCGWSDDGRSQARQTITVTGIDVLTRLRRLHLLTRQHLGQTKLRHRYSMPCTRCGAPLGRDDGTTIITCDNRECGASWTERDYRWLSTLYVDDEKTTRIVKFLLAEGYSRLDRVADLVKLLDDDPDVDREGAGRLILDHLAAILGGDRPHVAPVDRQVATNKAAAEKRQQTEDGWAWKQEPRYKRPKRKPAPEPRTDLAKIASSLLTTLTDISVDGRRGPVCGVCWLTKPCDCEEPQ